MMNTRKKPEFCYKLVHRWQRPAGAYKSLFVPAQSLLCCFYQLGVRTTARDGTPGIAVFMDLETAMGWASVYGAQILKCRYSRSTLKPRRSFPLTNDQLYNLPLYDALATMRNRGMLAPGGTYTTKWVEPVEVLPETVTVASGAVRYGAITVCGNPIRTYRGD